MALEDWTKLAVDNGVFWLGLVRVHIPVIARQFVASTLHTSAVEDVVVGELFSVLVVVFAAHTFELDSENLLSISILGPCEAHGEVSHSRFRQ